MNEDPFCAALLPVMDNLVRETITPEELAEREALMVIARALVNKARWIHMGREEGGLDCAGLIEYVFKKAGHVPADATVGYYPADFMMHVFDKRFVEAIERFARKVHRSPLPGDIALYYYGKTRGAHDKLERMISHCALVDKWPLVIHARMSAKQVIIEESDKGELMSRFAGVWSLDKWS